MVTTDPGASLASAPVLVGYLSRAVSVCCLVAIACGLLFSQTTVLGQAVDPAINAWLSKLRSIDSFEPRTPRPSGPSGPSANADSSLADPPSPKRLAELFDLVLSPKPKDRNRFLCVDTSPRSKLRRERLRSALESAGLLDELLSIVQKYASDEPGLDAVSQGPFLEPSDALIAMLGLESPGTASRVAIDRDPIQVKRSSANFPLLGWGPGTYQSARSTHFAIVSQASDKVTAEVAEACEVIFDAWQSLFGERFEFPLEQTQAFRVVLLRNKEAYVRALKSIEPRISISTGYFSPEHRMAFFYWEGPKSFPTLVHELTHQFFDATLSDESRFNADTDAGAWALEAVALYMESWSEECIGGVRVIDIGGWDAPRVQAGRFRRLRDQYWIPWEEFSIADGKRLRADPDVAAWYSQACGLAHMWLDSDAASRDAFLSYLQEVYKGQGAKASGALTDDDTLRSAYDQYLLTGSYPQGDPKVTYSQRPAFLRRNEVVLTRCPIESQMLLNWPESLRKATWLDLGFTQVDDELFSQSGSIGWDVGRLNLESTQITDASLPVIAAMKNLTELDLSGCKVTDTGLEALAKHPSLRQLWLTNTGVSDRSVEVLASIPKLDKLEASGALSADGYQKLVKKKPRLKKP